MEGTVKYLVRLRPLDSFFFSGKKTFRYKNGKKRKDRQGKLSQSHYVESEKYPQQTTLLGVIRKELLIKKGWYRENRSDYAKAVKKGELDSQSLYDLIGKGSFKANSKNDFGMIKKLSPVFLYKEDKYYIENPMDKGLELKSNIGKTYIGNMKKPTALILEGYNAKQGLENILVSTDNLTPENKVEKIGEVFKEDFRTGIDIHEEEGFYKQKFYKLEKEWEFGFFLELKEPIFENRYESIIQMGLESKPFKMIITESKNKLVKDYKNSGNKITLLGDTILRESEYEEIKDCSEFILGELKYFKNFRVVEGKKIKSDPLWLLKRGTVIFPTKENYDKIARIIKNSDNSCIGYNWILEEGN